MSDEKNLNDDLNEAVNEARESTREFGHEAQKTVSSGDNKKVIAGVLAIVLGTFGVHKFILGYNKEGIIMLSIGVVGILTTCLIIGAFIIWIPGIIGLVEGIIYLTKTDEEFYRTYQLGKKPWF